MQSEEIQFKAETRRWEKFVAASIFYVIHESGERPKGEGTWEEAIL